MNKYPSVEFLLQRDSFLMSGFFRNSQHNPQGFAPPPQTPYYSSYPPQQHTPLQRSHTLCKLNKAKKL